MAYAYSDGFYFTFCKEEKMGSDLFSRDSHFCCHHGDWLETAAAEVFTCQYIHRSHDEFESLQYI